MQASQQISSQMQRDRINRHNKLVQMINNYHLTNQQQIRLQKIKSHTMMQINLRFLKSQSNKCYQFPFSSTQQESNDQKQDNLMRQHFINNTISHTKDKDSKHKNNRTLMYDLRVQNYDQNGNHLHKQIKDTLLSNQIALNNSKIASLTQSRRVHSLGNERSHQKDQIIRRHNRAQNYVLKGDKYLQKPSKSMLKSQPKASNSTRSLKILPKQYKKQPYYIQEPISKFILSPSPNKLIIQNKFAIQKKLSIQKKKNIQKKLNIQTNRLLQSNRLKLPQIQASSKSSKKLSPFHLKTQKQQDLYVAIGKKLNTQVTQYSDQKKRTKITGVEKYLKGLEMGKLINKKNKHLNQFNIPVFKTTKNSNANLMSDD